MFILSLSTINVFAKNQKIIKVGYFDYKGLIEKDKWNNYSGYGVDYLDKIAEYTGWQYQYVYDSWGNLLKKLENKEIDLLCNAQYSLEREKIFDYSRYPSGSESSVLYARKDDSRYYYEDFKAYNNMRVGQLYKSYQNKVFAEYAKKNNFKYKAVNFNTDAECFKALDEGVVDVVSVGSLSMKEGYKIIAKFNSDPFYFITGNGRIDILNPINEAMNIIKATYPDFESNLYEKYYENSKNSITIPLTRSEMQYIKNAPVLKVAVNINSRPMAYKDNSGNPAGIGIALLNKISEISGLKFEYFYVNCPCPTYNFDLYRDNNVDLISGLEINKYNKNIKQLSLSSPYFTSMKSFVQKYGKHFTAEDNIKIAIVGGIANAKKVVLDSFPNAQVFEYENIQKCLYAVKHGKADALLDNQYVLDEQLNRPQFTDLGVVPGLHIEESRALSPILLDTDDKQKELSNSTLLSIINKAIGTITNKDIEGIVIDNTITKYNSLSIEDVLYKYRVMVILVTVFLIIILSMMFSIAALKHKNYLKIISKNKQLADTLIQVENANNAKSDFLSHMSHEIRTPLNAIVGISDIARNYVDNPHKIEDCLDKIEKSSEVLLNLINDVLDMSAIEENKLKIAHSPFNFKELISSVASLYYSQCKQKKINFDVQYLGVTEEFLIGDSLRINQILLNLLSNAYKFTPQDGSITLKITQTEKRDDMVFMRFEVIDTGCGISQELMSRLFMPFEQNSAETARKYGGSGLGLSITKNLVDLLHGVISVYSLEGAGTTFTVDMPLDIDLSKSDSVERQYKDINILVVQENQLSLEFIKEVLSRIEVPFEVARDRDEAVEKLTNAFEKGSYFDICCLDWGVSEKSRTEIIQKIREKNDEHTTLIIATAYDTSEMKNLKESGVNMFVPKSAFQSEIYDLIMSLSGGKYSKKPEMQFSYDFKGKKVLLAEDNKLNHEIAIELLNLVGLEVESAFDGEQAVEMFENSEVDKYDAVLLDIQMPVMNGYEAARTIRNLPHPNAKTVPIFAMTADVFAEDISSAIAAGMNGHIAKPIDADNLYDTLAKAINKRRSYE